MSSSLSTIYLALALALVAISSTTGPVNGDDKLKDLIRARGFVEVKILEAHVPDLDNLPGQGDSDVFVRVYLNDTKELICETSIVQDKNDPKFDKECLSKKPVPSDTILRFEIYDSDKPAPEPDFIGLSKIKTSDLILNRKLDSKESFPIEGRQFPKHFIKVKIDFKPEK